jgi:hypothetical protein
VPVYARFNDPNYKYNDTNRLYGAGTEDTRLRWIIMVDWDGDGFFDGTNEAIYATDLSITDRGRDNYIKLDDEGKASGFEHVKIGKARIELKNRNGRFDPYNTSSPLYPYVLPGRYIYIGVNVNGTVYDVFSGKVKKIRPVSGTNPKVYIEAEDGGRLLQNQDMFIGVQENIDIDDAIGMVLDEAGYPSIWGRNLEDSGDVMNYWWADDRAVTEIQRLADAELGIFFIAADGKATFYSRHHSNTDVFSITQAEILKEVVVPVPWEAVRNIVKVVAHPRVLVTNQTLWELIDTPQILAGDSLTVWATYTYNNSTTPALNVDTPIATTDYLVNTAADGSGSDLTASCTITTFTDFGKTAKIIINNGSGSNGYITFMRVIGDALTAPNASTKIEEDAASQAIYEKQQLTVDSDWLQSTQLAGDFAEWLLSFLATPQKFLTVKLENRSTYQFGADLFDTIGLTITKLSVSGSFKVAGIEHQWLTENGQAVRTTWQLEPFPDTSGFWVFTTNIGQTSTFGI